MYILTLLFTDYSVVLPSLLLNDKYSINSHTVDRKKFKEHIIQSISCNTNITSTGSCNATNLNAVGLHELHPAPAAFWTASAWSKKKRGSYPTGLNCNLGPGMLSLWFFYLAHTNVCINQFLIFVTSALGPDIGVSTLRTWSTYQTQSQFAIRYIYFIDFKDCQIIQLFQIVFKTILV